MLLFSLRFAGAIASVAGGLYYSHELYGNSATCFALSGLCWTLVDIVRGKDVQ
jgi:hypothetical protein